MPRGDKSKYSDKQKRQAEHIEDSARARGRSTKVAERIAWATVNKQDGGGKRGGSASSDGRTSRRKTRARRSKSPTPRSQTRSSSATAHARGRRGPRSRSR